MVRLRRAVAAGAVLLTAAGTAGCAGSRTASARTGGIDFSQDQEANLAAADGSAGLSRDLPKFASYAGLRIVSYGIEVDNVGEPSAEMRAVVARDTPRYQDREIPVRFRLVRYSERDLDAVMKRLSADRDGLAKRGIQLSVWGPDMRTNKVEIGLAHYTEPYRDALLSRYGDRVTVTPHDLVTVGG